MPPLTALIPFTIGPPLILSEPYVSFSWADFLRGAKSFALHPFVLAYLQEICGQHVFLSTYTLVRQVILKPDCPDQISLQTHEENNQFFDTTFIRSASEEKTEGGDQESHTLVDQVRAMFPMIFQLWERVTQIRRSPSPVDLSPDLEAELINRSSVYYQALLDEDRGLHPEQRRPRRLLRRQAIRSALSHLNLVEPEPGLLENDWVDETVGRFDNSNASTSTPDPEDLFSLEDLIQQQADERSTNVHGNEATESAQNADHPISSGEHEATSAELADLAVLEATESLDVPATAAFEPIMPLETLVEGRPPGIQASPDLHALTPELGISRAPSLPQITPRPVRRPTDLGEDNRPTREDLIRHQTPPQMTRDSDDSQYRVTTLSHHPADNLARTIASIVTPILMLPLEMLFLRSLTRNFLISRFDNEASATTDPPLAHIWPLSPRTSMSDLGALRSPSFWGNWFTSLGIQGVISLITWTGSSYLTLHLGHQFGWGKF